MHSKIPPYQSIRFRIIAVSAMGLLILAGALVFLKAADIRAETALYKNSQADREAIFNENLALHSASLRTYAYDYTYWDEMVAFIKTKDQTFAKENIDASLETYKASAVWVYDKSAARVHVSKNIAGMPADVPLSGMDRMKGMFIKDVLVHFYASTPQGIVEIYGAPIQPSSDVERTTPAQGYFFVGRLLEQQFLHEVGRSVRADIRVLTTADIDKGYVPYEPKDSKIAVRKELHDLDGTAVGAYLAVFDVNDIRHHIIAHEQMLWVVVGTYVGVMLIYTVLLIRWVLLPLSKVHNALQQKDSTSITDLVTHEGEFGQIARMIAHFFDQQKDMAAEVAAQRDTQSKLENQAHELERMNSLMIGRELKMAELKKRLRQYEQEGQVDGRN